MNKYEVLGVVGEGAYGIVLKCRNKASGEIVAIKKFKESEEDEAVRKTIVREVKLLRMLRQENIVQLNEAFRRKQKLYLVFEYVDKNLLEVLEEMPNGVDPVLIQRYIYQMCKAIEFCHRNEVIHRDIKPENLLVSLDHRLMLCDFGFARIIPKQIGPITDYVATRWYRAPELLLGTGLYGIEIDIWAIGCIMGELVDGKPLIPGESDMDQLVKTVKLLGPLSSMQQTTLKSVKRLKGIRFDTTGAPDNIDRRYIGRLPRIALQFMKACLQIDPNERLTALQALRHPYFDSIRDRCYDVGENMIQPSITPDELIRVNTNSSINTSKNRGESKSVFNSQTQIKFPQKPYKPKKEAKRNYLPNTTKHENPKDFKLKQQSSSRNKGSAEDLRTVQYKNYLNDIKSMNIKRKREDEELHRKAKMLKQRHHKPNRRMYDIHNLPKFSKHSKTNENLHGRALPYIRSQGHYETIQTKKAPPSRGMPVPYSEEPDSGGGPQYAFGKVASTNNHNYRKVYDYDLRMQLIILKMAHKLHKALQYDLYSSYAPENHYETTAEKLRIPPNPVQTYEDRVKNDAWRQFAGVKHLTPSRFHDLEEQRRQWQKSNYYTNTSTVEQQAKQVKEQIRAQKQSEMVTVKQQMSDYKAFQNEQIALKQKRATMLKKSYDNQIQMKQKQERRTKGVENQIQIHDNPNPTMIGDYNLNQFYDGSRQRKPVLRGNSLQPPPIKREDLTPPPPKLDIHKSSSLTGTPHHMKTQSSSPIKNSFDISRRMDNFSPREFSPKVSPMIGRISPFPQSTVNRQFVTEPPTHSYTINQTPLRSRFLKNVSPAPWSVNKSADGHPALPEKGAINRVRVARGQGMKSRVDMIL